MVVVIGAAVIFSCAASGIYSEMLSVISVPRMFGSMDMMLYITDTTGMSSSRKNRENMRLKVDGLLRNSRRLNEPDSFLITHFLLS